MFMNPIKIMFLFILMMGSIISISSSSWLGCWMGLEINLLSFIPLMKENMNLVSSESSLKYFIVQALASSILLFSIIILLFMFKMPLTFNNKIEMMITLSLLLKMGSAPFHFWFPLVMDGLSWLNSMILMTWQKLTPMILVSYQSFNYLILISIILSVYFGSIGGLNQTSLRKMMAYSSINHLGWMLMAMKFSVVLSFSYFCFYSIISISLSLCFYIFNIFHLNQLFSLFLESAGFKLMVSMNLLSLGGLPPFLGFFPKWSVIQLLSENKQFLEMTVLVLMTLITLFYYLRLCFSSMMLSYYEISWKSNSMEVESVFMIFMFISTIGMLLLSMFFYLF